MLQLAMGTKYSSIWYNTFLWVFLGYKWNIYHVKSPSIELLFYLLTFYLPISNNWGRNPFCYYYCSLSRSYFVCSKKLSLFLCMNLIISYFIDNSYLWHLLIYLAFVFVGAIKFRLDIIKQSLGTPGLNYWSLQR